LIACRDVACNVSTIAISFGSGEWVQRFVIAVLNLSWQVTMRKRIYEGVDWTNIQKIWLTLIR